MMKQYYVVLSDLSSQARAHAFSTELRAERFQRLQFGGAGHLFPVKATDRIEQASGSMVHIVYQYSGTLEPLAVGATQASALAAVPEAKPELHVKMCYWEPVLAANEAGLTHYHVHVGNDATPRVVPSFVHHTKCYLNCALEDGRSNIMSIPDRPSYHVAARSAEEALEIVSEYAEIMPAGKDSVRVMETLVEKRLELLAYVEGRTSAILFLSLEVDGQPWFAVYDRCTGCIVRAFQKVGTKYREVIHADLPFKLEKELVVA